MTSEKPRRRWFRFSLWTMFVVVAVFGVLSWVAIQLNWIRERHAAVEWLGTQAKYWDDMPVDQRTRFGVDAPWQIRLFGERGVEGFAVFVYANEVAPQQRRLERLFPEAQVHVHTAGTGYHGKHEAEVTSQQRRDE